MSTPDDKPATVLSQADALMQRHRRVSAITGQALPGAPKSGLGNDEDLPVLTDVVEADSMAEAAAPIDAEALKQRIHSAVGANDAELARALERWIATQLPQALSQALDNVAEQLKTELAAKLRAELLTRPMFDQDPDKPGR